MPPKTSLDATPQEIVDHERIVNPRTYSDYPECLPKFKWLVQESIKDASKMFNPGPSYYCKCCGLPVPRSDWEKHVKGHGTQLGLVKKPGVTAVHVNPELAISEPAALWNDMVAIVTDSLGEKAEGLDFNADVIEDVANVLYHVTAEDANLIGAAPFCVDCAN